MENLRRIIIPWTDNGYNFNFNASDNINSCVALITTVVKNSPAEAAGLRVGDGIVSINGNLLRGLAKSEIYSLIKNFRNANLILTVLQNYDHNEDKKIDGPCLPDEQASQSQRHNHHIPPMNTKMLSLKYSGLVAGHSGCKADTGGPRKARKFSKYSRNMSDVTQQNSRFYYQHPGAMGDSCCHRPSNCVSISPPHRMGPLHLEVGSSCATHQLELNRVGGILRKPVSAECFRNHLLVVKPPGHDVERKNKFTYLTCSPIPYRSGRVLDVSEIQERRSLPEQSVRESIYEHMSTFDPETKDDPSQGPPSADKAPSNSESVEPNISQRATGSICPVTELFQATSSKPEFASGKGKLHHALNRVRNFTQRRLNSTDSQSDFKKQQEEWLQKTEPHFIMVSEKEESREMTVNICTDHLGYLGDKVHIPHQATLPLDKWQRSGVSPLIPLVVEICVKVIEKFGIHHVGIYRVSGNKLSLDSINTELRRPLCDIDLTSDVWNDIYAISGVLKSFLRNLPDGVFPKDYYFEIIGAWKQYEKDREKRLLSVQRLLSILDSVPDHLEYRHHRETLRFLASHLFVVSSKNSINKMTAKNLAVVFAPTLLRPPVETNEILMSDYRFRIELVESIINHHEWMFSPSFESACTIPEEVDQENTLLSEMQFESFTEDQIDADKIDENQEDARVLIREIIDRVREMSPHASHNEADSNQYTLIELNTMRERGAETATARLAEANRYTEQSSVDLSPEISETLSTKEKKSSKRLSFKLSKSKHVKSNFPRDQLLLTNKKLCALSIALISSNRQPLNSALITENESPKIAVE